MPQSSYESHAGKFIELRSVSSIGVETLQSWSDRLTSPARILDIGCGSGKPLGITLAGRGHLLFGIDCSATLAKLYEQTVPKSRVECANFLKSDCFHLKFDATIAIGVIFLLTSEQQQEMIRKIASCLAPKGHVLFTAPTQVHQWKDVITGSISTSLGREQYLKIGIESGLRLVDEYQDEGGNHYYAMLKC
ncbi:class I SAM-dependent methyltransferase [Undibacterium cyanobacteriorum]|uniref:Class I SAM-dependent methyltransferase n=1 Tax=Undibacterium cyanobacteriorum TaxID=3073561 RepID=A0ABY9RGG8_9BURK|nr:class I SAM-dependent methyltransferase [Undibacterium sp. 20NA77.5]WMW80316.1 class I SAM-dependent methyltransferase [Undibacterium sp. 20NA77.5]